MNKFVKFIIFCIALLSHPVSVAQLVKEHISAETDQTCYVVGEHLKLSVQVNLPNGTPSPSRVIYVEIADTAKLYNQTMLTLDGGFGYGELSLPQTMHSGTYQLSIYTRGLRNFGEPTFYTKQIGVINPVKFSPEDNIRFLPAVNDDIVAKFDSVSTPNTCVEVIPTEYPFSYELEGHIVTAHVSAAAEDVENVRLALVGKSTLIYDGRNVGNGNYEFYTTEVYGEQPSFVSAYSQVGKSLPTTLVSPYAQVLPAHLPQLIVYCSEEALKNRYADALRQMAIDDWHHKGTEPRKATFMSSTPQYVYDLDEWARMNTVSEMLTEFIKGVHVKRTNGVPQMYTYSQCPALVLFDGVPIYDIEAFLDSDPSIIKYVQIYDDRYTFGQTFCYGVVSFISHSGKLPNLKLDKGSTFVTYQFPQPTQLTTK